MKPNKHLVLGLVASSFLIANAASAADMLTEQKKAACEATMCLMAADRPTECEDSLKEYFKIQIRSRLGFDPRETAKARENFLELCPKEDSETRFRTETANQDINTNVDTTAAKENIASTDLSESSVSYSENERDQAQDLGITDGQLSYYDAKAPQFSASQINQYSNLLDTNAGRLSTSGPVYDCGYDIGYDFCVDGVPIVIEIDIGELGGEGGMGFAYGAF